MTFWRLWRQRSGGTAGASAGNADRHPAPSDFTEAAALFERFDHLLSLADRCPRSAAADRLRRSVHDSIEAGSLADRRKHLARVLDELDVMRRHHGSGPGVAAGSLITAEPLLAALHAAVVSILAPES